MRRLRGSHRRPGFTLVEILIALIILAVLAAILFLSFRAVNQVRDRQGELSGTDDAAVSALHQLSRDLTAMVKGLSDEEGLVVSASGVVRESSGLLFTTLQPMPRETDRRWYEQVRVEYKVQQHPFATPTLIRCSWIPTGPHTRGTVVTNALVQNIDYFRVELFDGKAWHADWDTRQKKEWPQAASLKLMLREGPRREQATRIFIPLGNPVTTSFERGSPAGPGAAPATPSGNPPQ